MWIIILSVVLAIALLGLAFLGGYLYRAMRHIDFMSDIVDFHEKFELNYDGPPRVFERDLFDFRARFMHEELKEYIDEQAFIAELMERGQAISLQGKIDQCLEKQLDALVDLTYVTLGAAYLQFGAEIFNEAWERVHHANMQKVRKLSAGEGHTDSGRAAKYDVVKPAGWQAPDHSDLIARRHCRSS